MALLDFLKTPEGQGLLSMVAGGMATARRGQPINSLGAAGMAGLSGYAGAQDRQAAAGQAEQNKLLRDMEMQQAQAAMEKQAQEAKALQAYQGQFTNAVPGAYEQGGGEGPIMPGTPAMFGGQEISPQLAALGPSLAPKDMYAAMNPDGGATTSEIKNYNFGQKLPEAERAMFNQKPSTTPSAIQEWEAYQKMPAEQKAAFLEMKRNPQFLNLGGTQYAPGPGGSPGRSYPVTPKLEDTAPFKADVAEKVAIATAGVAQGTETVKKVQKADTLISQIDQAESILAEGDATGSLLGAGVAASKGVVGLSDKSTQDNQKLELISGWMVSNVPRMEGPQSNFDVQNYKTMAAVVGDKTKPIGDRMAALSQLQILQDRYKDVQGGATPAPTLPAFDNNEYLKAISAAKGDKGKIAAINARKKELLGK